MEKYFKLHLYYASIAIVLLISIAYVSLMPLTGLPKTGFEGMDKVVHLIMYFVLSLFIAKGFFNLENSSLSIKAIPILLSFFYGFSIEIAQDLFTNFRFFEIFDILANGIGCLLALVVINKRFLTEKQ